MKLGQTVQKAVTLTIPKSNQHSNAGLIAHCNPAVSTFLPKTKYLSNDVRIVESYLFVF